MKVLNIILSSLALAILGSYGVSLLLYMVFGGSIASILAFPIALAFGLFSRMVVEKFLGYTLLEALMEKPEKEEK